MNPAYKGAFSTHLSALQFSCLSAKPFQKDHQDQHRHHIPEVRLERSRHPDSRTGIALLQIFIKSPAPLRYTEQKVDKRTDWQQQVTYDKVLTVKYIPSANQVEITPYILS